MDETNTTDGSRWIVKLKPTPNRSSFHPIPPTAVGGSLTSSLHRIVGWALNIHRLPSVVLDFRLKIECSSNLNQPPTAVGGIGEVASIYQGCHQAEVDDNQYGLAGVCLLSPFTFYGVAKSPISRRLKTAIRRRRSTHFPV
jgi:hypothetical protein